MAPAKPRGPDWVRIKAEYIAGGVSYPDLARKYGVSRHTLEKRATREAWRDDLRETCGEIAGTLPAAVAAVVVDAAAQVAAQNLADLELYRQVLLALLPGTKEKDGRLTPEAWVRAFKDMQAAQRKALNLPDTVTATTTPVEKGGTPDASKHGTTIVPADSPNWRGECESTQS